MLALFDDHITYIYFFIGCKDTNYFQIHQIIGGICLFFVLFSYMIGKNTPICHFLTTKLIFSMVIIWIFEKKTVFLQH